MALLRTAMTSLLACTLSQEIATSSDPLWVEKGKKNSLSRQHVMSARSCLIKFHTPNFINPS